MPELNPIDFIRSALANEDTDSLYCYCSTRDTRDTSGRVFHECIPFLVLVNR